ncbi:hypothetical protein ACVWW3_003270 [Bradyrhizobium sp. LM2.9]
MPHYHFDLVDSKTVADEEGADLPDDIQALDVAEEIAKRLLKERPPSLRAVTSRSSSPIGTAKRSAGYHWMSCTEVAT